MSLYVYHDQKFEMVGNNTWLAFKPKIYTYHKKKAKHGLKAIEIANRS